MLIFVNVSFSKKSQRGGGSNIEKSAESKGFKHRYLVDDFILPLNEVLSNLLRTGLLYYVLFAPMQNFLCYLFTATSYIKYFGYVQFAGIIAAPLTGLLFRENITAERLPAKEEFANKVKMLILPGFVFISILILMDGLQMIGNIHLSVSFTEFELSRNLNVPKLQTFFYKVFENQ